MNITAKELSGRHLGKTVTFVVPGYNGEPITKRLQQIRHYATFVSLHFSSTNSACVEPWTPITIQEGQ